MSYDKSFDGKTIDLFTLIGWALKRDCLDMIHPEGRWINLGAGRAHLPGSVSLDLPQWDGEKDPLPYADNSVDHITAFHVLEHFSGPDAIRVLRECERVLRLGGLLTVGMPHWSCEMAHHDLDHKSFWSEDTWKRLLENEWYDKMQPRPWRLAVRTCFIAGVVQRNLMVFTQLVKLP